MLELGCGTGRVALPLAGPASTVVGIDRSDADAGARAPDAMRRGQAARAASPDPRRHPRTAVSPRALSARSLAPYGILQSLLRERDLAATLEAVAGVLPGGTFGLELVADLPLAGVPSAGQPASGRRGRRQPITLVESVRQDRAPAADALRSGVRRTARARTTAQAIHPDLPHGVGAADDRAGSRRPASGDRPARRLPRRPVGPPGRGLDRARAQR